MKLQKNATTRHIAAAILCVALILSAAFSSVILYMDHKSKHEHLHSLMSQQADEMENNVHEALMGVYSLQTLVLGSNGEELDLEKMGSYIIQEKYKEFVRNILNAPDGVVEQVYPLEGNEQAIGLNLYSEDNATNQEAKEAGRSRQIVVTGPFSLVQGG